MADFFGSLNSSNVRFTDARINGDGPLPTSLSGPEGINGDPDGRYNFNESLLSGITPYAFGQGRMNADRNYQQIPHRKQFAVPPIWLPEPAQDALLCFRVSHPIDMGDLVFIINADYKQYLLTGMMKQSYGDMQEHSMPQYNAFCNICTVNYILAGIHNYILTAAHGNDTQKEHAWLMMLRCFDMDTDANKIVDNFQEENTKIRASSDSDAEKKAKNDLNALGLMIRCKVLLQTVIRDKIKPIGICSASEKQGGQHEVGFKPVQAAANFFVTLTVDGQNRDLVNIWRGVEPGIEGGDQLILRLKMRPMGSKSTRYVLNHYYKDTVMRSIKFHDDMQFSIQLIPDVYSTKHDSDFDSDFDTLNTKFNPIFRQVLTETTDFNEDQQTAAMQIIHKMCLTLYDYRQSGYWHIGQTYIKQATFAVVKGQAPVDDMEMTRGQPMQVNFAPVWNGRTSGECTFILNRRKQILEACESEEEYIETLCKQLVVCDAYDFLWFDLVQWMLAGFDPKLILETIVKSLVLRGESEEGSQDGDDASVASSGGAGGGQDQQGQNQQGEFGVQLNLGANILPPANKRFKKSMLRTQDLQTENPRDLPTAELIVTSGPGASIQAPREAVGEAEPRLEIASVWDFEKDLEAIVKEVSEPKSKAPSRKKSSVAPDSLAQL